MKQAELKGPRTVRAPHGTTLSCRGWTQEAAFRMLQNNLDPDVAERPMDLVVYGGIGKAARNWEAFDKILAALKTLADDETLLIQSGKPVGIVKTHTDAPRVLIANSNLVGKWATWDVFHELDKKGLMMYGQMTAGSWIYIGTQGIVQGTYETFAECGRQHFSNEKRRLKIATLNGTAPHGAPSKGEAAPQASWSDDELLEAPLKGCSVLTAGLGGMGGAQPLAAVFAGAASLNVEVDKTRIDFRLRTKYVDELATDIDDAIARIEKYKAAGIAKSVALHGNMSEVIHQLIAKGFKPDVLTDQTSAHDPINGYVPAGFSLEKAAELRSSDPKKYEALSIQSMAKHVDGMLAMKAAGAVTFDYGNNIRARAVEGGTKNAFDIPGFVPEYIRPLFCKGSGPFRFVALSGDPNDIKVCDDVLRELFPQKKSLHRWLDMAQERIAFQGLPARICWLEYGERAKAGLAINELVRTGKVKAPVVIGRDHLDCGSVASPNRETEAMKDGSDAIGDWPILNALVNTACGATWVSFHHGGGVGMGYSLHAGQVILADGTAAAAKRLDRVLTADPAMGVFRHVDAGYEDAMIIAKERNIQIP